MSEARQVLGAEAGQAGASAGVCLGEEVAEERGQDAAAWWRVARYGSQLRQLTVRTEGSKDGRFSERMRFLIVGFCVA